eukprot:scaffold20464_cov17-Prasinocladus_malaysianus.AAC.2
MGKCRTSIADEYDESISNTELNPYTTASCKTICEENCTELHDVRNENMRCQRSTDMSRPPCDKDIYDEGSDTSSGSST